MNMKGSMLFNSLKRTNPILRAICIIILPYSYFFFLYGVHMSGTTNIDDKWTAIYGNDPLKSGVWEYLRTINNDQEKMKNISFQTHKKCFKLSPNIQWVNFSTKELHFPGNFDFKPIQIDVVMYTVEGRYQYKAPGVPYYFYLTKGMKANCVCYLVPRENEFNGKELNLLPGDICDLAMP